MKNDFFAFILKIAGRWRLAVKQLNPNLEESMKNAFFASFILAGSILSLSLFAQDSQKSLYYYRKNKTTPEKKTVVRVLIHKHVFIPLLESSLSEYGSIQVRSLKISDFPQFDPLDRNDATFTFGNEVGPGIGGKRI